MDGITDKLQNVAGKINSVSRHLEDLQNLHLVQLAQSLDQLQSQLESKSMDCQKFSQKVAELNIEINACKEETDSTQLRISVLQGNLKYRHEISELNKLTVGDCEALKGRSKSSPGKRSSASSI